LSQSAVRASLFAVALVLPMLGGACGSDIRGSSDGDVTDTAELDADTTVDDSAQPDTVDDTAAPDTTDDTGAPDTVDDTGAPDTADDTVEPDTADTVEADTADTTEPDTTPLDTVEPDTEPPVDTWVPPAPSPVPGDLVIAEVMIDPAAADDVKGEWVELLSLADEELELAGCVLTNGGAQQAVLSAEAGDSRVPAGARVVLGASADTAVNGGVDVDLAYAGVVLSNSHGALVLSCDGQEIDRIDYDAGHWVILPGVALAYSADGDTTAAANDDPTRWCEATMAYGDGDLGSPGAANATCPPRDGDVDRCALVAPLDFSAYEGDATSLFGRIYEAGATDQTPGVDPIYFLRAQAGSGPRGSDPSGDDWTWEDAVGAVAWDDANAPGEDQYVADVGGLAIGPYDIAFRFSLDAGATWTYCDATPGDGVYSVLDAGHLTVIDSPCVPNPCDTPPDAWCDDDVLVSYLIPGACEVDAGAADCAYTEHTTDCDFLGGRCEAGACVDTAREPTEGELVITEIMKNPRVVFDQVGEWVELKNVSDHPLDLAGCTIRDNAADSHEIALSPPLVVRPGELIVLGKSTDLEENGGAPVDYAYGADFNLNNTSDVVTFECGSAVIDTLTYLTSGWPNTTGASLNLEPKKTTAADNNSGSAWCVGVLPYPDADGSELGTPGAPNSACPEPIDRCRLVTPDELDLLDGDAFTAVGQVVESGVTTISGATDPDPLLLAEAGWGPANTTPDGDWSWTAAAPDATWEDSAAVGSDQYVATVDGPIEAGDFDVAFRFSADGGVTWTVCDLNTGTPGEDGSQNGYQLDNAGLLHVTLETACNPNPCTDPPAGLCDGDVLETFEAPGACALTGAALDTAECTFPARTVDCALLGGRCEAGTCVDAAEPPTPGDLVFTEIMRRPAAVADFFGEWAEVTNVSTATVNLDGCVVRDDDTDLHVIVAEDGALLVAPGERIVFGKDADPATNGGVAVDYAWGTDVTLGNGADELVLDCPDGVVDHVAWGGEGVPFPDSAGAAMQLTPSAEDADANDLGALWCDAMSAYGDGDLGTPGAPNEACAPVVGVCRFEAPVTATLSTGDAYTAEARLRFPGLTDRTLGTDAIAGVLVDLGLGLPGTLPADGAWSFAPAAPDPDWSDAEGWDAWLATVAAPGEGSYHAAFRVSVDGGETWLYCDRATGVDGEDGSEDGYQSDRAGQLETTDPCIGVVCDAPPEATCVGEVVTTFDDSGTCLAGECDYPPIPGEDCATRGAGWTCADGACLAPGP